MTRRLVFLGVCVALASGTADAARRRGTVQAGVVVRGQSRTILPDGSALFLGGVFRDGAGAEAYLQEVGGAAVRKLSPGLVHARYGHTATLLPDGTVLVLGGIGAAGRTEATAELFDPATGRSRDLPPTGLVPRAWHTATLLSDGTTLVAGGLSEDGETLAAVEIWDYRTRTAQLLSSGLIVPRSLHSATLLADGAVLLSGGEGRGGVRIADDEAIDPATGASRIVPEPPPPQHDAHPAVEFSFPADGAVDVPVDVVIAMRFSMPLDPATVNARTLTLSGPEGGVRTRVVPAERGMLAFVTPVRPLTPGVEYSLSLEGLGTGTRRVDAWSLAFTTTSAAAGPEADPDADGGSDALRSPWRDLPPLQAADGVTALAGQALRLSGRPLHDVTLTIGGLRAKTDATGRFLLPGIGSGHQVLLVDGRTADVGNRSYGVYEIGVDITAGRTNALAYTIWMTRIDTAHAVVVPSPTTAADTIVTTPRLPGLELHLPTGSVIYDSDDKVTQLVSITPIPLDKPPFPLPAGVGVPIFFTIQPGAGYIRVLGSSYAGGRLFYPNSGGSAPGTVFDFWNYDPDGRGWYVYGHGRTSADGASIVPDAGVEIHELTGAMEALPSQAPTTGPGNCCGGDPVDLGTGLFIHRKTDLTLADVIPVALTRTYRQGDSYSRAFGIGSTHPYDVFIVGDRNPYTYQQLVLEDGTRVHFQRTSSGTGYLDAVYQSTMLPGRYFGARTFWNGTGWTLALKDGTQFLFLGGYIVTPQGAALVAIRDRHGNQVTVTRDANLNVSQITSTNGRWLSFTYDSSGRITQAADNIGRTVGYTYDSSGRLSTVTDPRGGVTTYTYDTNNNMLTVQDPRLNVHVTNQYDTNGRLTRQTMADGGVYQFAYTLDGSGNVTQTALTDPRGVVRQVTFNAPPSYANGYRTSGTVQGDTSALGLPEQQTTTHLWQAGTNLELSSTDPLGRTTAYTYDAMGNTTSVTRLSGTPDAVTTSFTYDGRFNELATSTDALGHVTTLVYDGFGNLTSVTDPLGHQTTTIYNAAGQPATACDALANCTTYTYDGADLASVVDPLARATSFFTDAAGRVVAATDALGRTTSRTYTPLDQVASVIDPLAGQTTFTYDANKNLLTVTDANNHTTHYTYDVMDRVATHQDALLNQDAYVYDHAGNLTQATDRRGKVTTYSYDGLGRRSFEGYGTQAGPTYESTVTYSYDAGSRLIQANDSVTGTITRTYDGLDRLLSESTPQETVSYTYDAADRRSTMSAPGQAQVSYSYDNANRLTQIVQGATTIGFGYDSASRRTSLALPNGLGVGYSYDSASQLTSLNYTNGQTSLGTLTYGYDAARNRTSVGGTFARTNLPSSVTTALYNVNNALTQWGSTSRSYDANGNLTGDGSHVYAWDARNRLASIDSGATASFAYDPFGRRVSKTAGGTSTVFTYDGATAVREVIGGTNTATSLAGGIDEVFQRTDSAGARTFFADALGSSVALVDSSGTLQTQYTYEPFGTTTSAGTASTNPFAFTGRELDASGLYYYRARYYDPKVGRFLSEDPIGLLGGDVNYYAYVKDDPVRYRDPSGLLFDPGTMTGAGAATGSAAASGGAAAAAAVGGLIIVDAALIYYDVVQAHRLCVAYGICAPPKPKCDDRKKGCTCTCLGFVDPNWNPTDPNHGNRNVGQVSFDADCRAECQFRGFVKNGQAQYQCK